jgi:hypothetical protein
MNTPISAFRRRVYLLLCGLMLAPVLSIAGILDFLTSSNDLEAVTVTDMTPAGSLRRAPTPSNPVYFVAISAGFRDLGGMKGGEKPVARDLVNKTVLKALAKQGYLPVTGDQKPEIALVWAWGTLNAVFSPMAPSTMQLNHRQMVRFLGGEKLGFGSRHEDAFAEHSLMMGLVRGGDVDKLYDVARDDLYIAIISAYDLHLDEGKKPEMLWNTRISCPARGFWLPEAMPAMLAIATPFIGRETTKPVWVRATDKFRPEIQLGDPKIVEYIEQGRPSIIEVGPSK